MEADNQRRISREALEKRKAELDKQLDRAFGQYQALYGAVQECEYWLSVLTEEKDDGGKVGA